MKTRNQKTASKLKLPPYHLILFHGRDGRTIRGPVLDRESARHCVKRFNTSSSVDGWKAKSRRVTVALAAAS
jgi:hypothetical protein